MTDFSFVLEGGGPPEQVKVSDFKHAPRVVPGNRKLSIDPTQSGRFLLFTAPDGYWDRFVEAARVGEAPVLIVFPKIIVGRTAPWWHRLQRVVRPSSSPNGPLRIGVIDEGLAHQGPESCIAHVRNLGAAAWAADAPRAFAPHTRHAHAVCSLIGSRANPSTGFPGVYPEAELYFAAAGRDQDEKLSISRIGACIELLVDVHQCDIISISAGDYESPLRTLEAAVGGANDRGTLCFFAAGNTGTPLYPARYPVCLAVAALGRSGMAPPGTNIKYVDLQQSEPLSGPLYLWNSSARGPEIEFCAPGVGVIWSANGAAAKAAIGTSYACPIAAAVAARILARSDFQREPRGPQRFMLGLQALIEACSPIGNADEGPYWKYGRLVVP